MQKNMNAAQLVRGLRARLGLSQRRMAEICQTQQPVVSMIESDTPGKGMSAALAQRMLDCFTSDITDAEREFLGDFLGERIQRRTHVQIYLPSVTNAPLFAEFLIALSKASSDEMLSLTEQELQQWLYDQFFTKEQE